MCRERPTAGQSKLHTRALKKISCVFACAHYNANIQDPYQWCDPYSLFWVKVVIEARSLHRVEAKTSVTTQHTRRTVKSISGPWRENQLAWIKLAGVRASQERENWTPTHQSEGRSFSTNQEVGVAHLNKYNQQFRSGGGEAARRRRGCQ